jgi:hypothetical protein
LSTHCQRFRLHHITAELSTVLDQVAKKDVTYTDFLDNVLAREVKAK